MSTKTRDVEIPTAPRVMQAFAAHWDTIEECYACCDLGIWSRDGETWYHDDGAMADGAAWHTVSIRLSGGPLNGKTVE